ncbi:MAG TPA: DUF4296 domain-containing protein [Saprospiraceae bacterium]|nr:DUF4296 domain-containing protein [Saprospiraceae bacterium]HPI05112.1 DUF4296 domain-containing protein [Saprospiraceae bacterium]
MRICLIVLLMATFVSACNFQKSVEQPTVSEDKMARILADLAIADAATNGIAGYEKDSLAQLYFRQVLEMHGLTLEQHEKNLRIFANDSGKMKELLNEAGALVDTSKWH